MTMRVELVVSGVTELNQRFEILGREDSEEGDNIFIRILTDLGEVLKPKLAEHTPLGTTGQLRFSTNFRVRVFNTDVAGEKEYHLEMIQTARSVGFTYRPIVVSGRLPGRMPPPLALRGWVQLRWGLSTVDANRAAFRLARHIAAHGTQPNDYVEKTVQASQGDIENASKLLGQELSVAIFNFNREL